MKVAVTSQGETMDSPVDQRFGRTRGFVIVDVETGEVGYISNEQNLNALQGAGIKAAENVSRQNVEAVITGHCGPKAFRMLKTAGVQVVTGAQGTVKQAIEEYKKGNLRPSDSADVDSHWT